MKFPNLPVLGFRGTTRNFEVLQSRLTGIEQSFGSAYRNAAQGIPNTTFTLIKLDQPVEDPNHNFDLANGWYVVPTDGIYQLTGWAAIMLPGEPAYDFIVSIVIGAASSEVARGTRVSSKAVAEGLVNAIASCVRKCTKGEKIGLAVYQNSGAERNLEVSAVRQNRLDVMRIV